MAMTPRQKYERKTVAHTTVLNSPFAGIPVGARLHISTPRDVDARIRRIPLGSTLSVSALRDEMAREHEADATCPVTTAIHLRTIIELAIDELSTGTAIDDVTPFWRVVEPDSTLARKVDGAREVIEARRHAERISDR